MKQLLLFSSLLFSSFFIGCTSQKLEKPDHTFHLSADMDPTTFDPRCARDLTTVCICDQMQASLVRVNRYGTLVYDLAKDIIAVDEFTYTIRLKDAIWSDGRPITAYDLRYSWLSTLDPQMACQAASNLFIIRGAKEFHEGSITESLVKITILNEKEVQIQLKCPCSFFKSLLATPGFSIIQAHFDQEIRTWNDPTTIPVSGPYFIFAYTPHKTLVLKKNKLFHAHSEITQETLVIHITDDSESISLLEKGAIDWAGSPLGTIPQDSLHFLKQRKWLYASQAAATMFLRLNTFHPYLKDKLFRQAIFYAIQREKILPPALADDYTPAYSLIPPCLLPGKGSDIDQRAFKEKATRLMEELSLKWGMEPKSIALRLSYSQTSERSKLLAQAIKANLEEVLGISVALIPYEPRLFFQRISALTYDISIGSYFADFLHPYAFFSLFETQQTKGNDTGWENKRYQALLRHLLEAKEGSHHEKTLMKNLQRVLEEEMPIIPLFHFSFLHGSKQEFQPIGISPLGLLDTHTEVIEDK